MRVTRALLPLLLLGPGAVNALAQQQATAVQLPTYSFFTVPTTVSVPDRGSTYLGGVNRMATGRNEFGAPFLPKNRAFGSEVSSSSARAHVFIHDFEAMEQEMADQSPSSHAVVPLAARREPPALPPNPWAGKLAAARTAAAGRPAMSVAEARRLFAQNPVDQSQDEKALVYVRQGREAESQGKLREAALYYKMAARRSAGDLRDQLMAKLAAIAEVEPGPAVVQAQP